MGIQVILPVTVPIREKVLPVNIRAHLHPATVMRLQRHCDVTPNGLQSHFQATDKFDASIDADAWCNSTGQNPYILIWE